jgi:chaperonin cofactor prefoldin
MKHFSFKVIFLCLVAPPVLYLVAMHYAERYLDAKYRTEIEQIYIGDTGPLFDGTKTLKQAVNENIERYLGQNLLVAMGGDIFVTVITSQGVLLYPGTYQKEHTEVYPKNPIATAAENYAVLNRGLNLRVVVNLDRSALPANLLLAFLIVCSALVLYRHYRAGTRKAAEEYSAAENEIARLYAKQQAYADQMAAISREREALDARVSETKKKLETEREKSEQNEEDLIEEIVALEKDLGDNLSKQAQQQDLIDELKKQVEALDKQIGDVTPKAADGIQKRFETLYKNTVLGNRAIAGYNRLPGDLKLKGEEVIHQLNEDAGKVQIKRKVFGKKNRETVFEVIFGYKGRLYFRRLKDNRVEVLSIGTKNTQRKDLEFLDKL